jgi:hypothetical protein
MLQVAPGENSARVVALQILLNRSKAIAPKLTTDGDFGDKTRAAVDLYRDKEMRTSGPKGVADPALWRFLLARAELQVVDAVDVTDPLLLEHTVPEISKWGDPIVLGAMSNGIAQLVREIRARVKGNRSLMMLRLHGHGSAGLHAVSHGSRRIWKDFPIDPVQAQSVISEEVIPKVMPQLRQLEPLFNDFGFVELHSCHVAEGPKGASFVRKLAVALQAPVRAAHNVQQAKDVFILTGPTSTGFPGAGGLKDWGYGRKEGVRATYGPPAPPPPERGPKPGTLISRY